MTMTAAITGEHAVAEVLSWARTSLAARAAGVATGAMDHADVAFGLLSGLYDRSYKCIQ